MGERHGVSRFEATRNAQRSLFVGRGQEVGLLLDRWEQAKAGDGQLVLLSGEAGIGKSRIAETMVQQIQPEPHHRIRYQCTPQHTNSPLYPAIVQLATAAGLLPEDDAAARLAKLASAMPDAAGEQIELVAALLGAPIPEGSPLSNLTPARRRELTLAAFVTQIGALCRQRPVLWVVEDTHWIDPTTEELVSRVVGTAGAQRLLIVVTHRPTYDPPWTSAPIATQLALNRLSRTHAGALLDGLGGGKPVPPEALEYILDRTDGVPLYMEELFQALRDSGTLRETATDFELARSLEETAVPATLQDALMARLDRLAPAKAVAQLGAAIGREFDQGLLTAVAALRPEALREGLDQLLAAGLIFVRGQPPEAIYIFKHALVQDAAYGSLLKAQRQAIHVRVSEALIARQGDVEPEVIAQHLERSGNLPQAIDWWERAGDAASQSSASGEAIAHYQSALSLHDGISADLAARRQRAKLCQKLAATLMQTEGFQSARAKELYEESQKIALDAHDPDTYVRGSVALWTSQYQRGLIKSALAKFEGLSQSTLSEITVATRAKFLRARGTARYCVGRLVDARSDFIAAMQAADTLQTDPQHSLLVGDPAVSGRAYASRTLLVLGWPDRGLEMARDGVRLARNRGHAFDIEWALQAFGATSNWLRRFSEGAEALAEALSICERHGFESHRGVVLVMSGVAKIGLGDTAQGTADFDRGLEIWRTATGPIHLTQYMARIAEACVVRREFDLADRYLADAKTIVGGEDECTYSAELLRLGGLLCEVQGRREQAMSRLREAIAVADAQEANGFKLRAARDLARLLAADGDVEGARNLLAPVYAWFTEGFDTPDLKEAKALLDQLATR
ncbi:MAG: AAA family ATPase [Alphaproteobacteria bacterium]|nr:AAA family ATPase [Alphaproteobacteria bacterium]